MSFDYAKKIAALIAYAEDESQSDEARATYREKAERLMREYQISQEDLIATSAESVAVEVPVADSIVLMEGNVYFNDLRHYYAAIFKAIAKYCGVRTVMDVTDGWSETGVLTGHVIGYEMDIKYLTYLWTSARLTFLTRIDARVNRALSDQLNCYFMRGSGMARIDIAEKLWGPEARLSGPLHAKVQKLYVAECRERGETPKVSGRGIQVKIYREAYAAQFAYEFSWRLQNARDAVDAKDGALILPGRKERVDAAFYAAYPDKAPKTPEEQAAFEERQRKLAEAEANCGDCAKTSSKTGKCRRHRPYEATAADRRAYDRKYRSAEAEAGRRAGSSAAQSINVQRGFERANATDAAQQRTALGS